MKNLKLSFYAILTIGVFTSCTNDDVTPVEAPLGAYQNGILIINEGNFGQDNSSMSYLSGDLATFQLNAFTAVNPSLTLGNTSQSIAFNNDKAYVVVHASNKIEVLNRYTLAHIATVTTGLSSPRFMHFANGKGYVTNWGAGSSASDDFVAVLNLTSNSVSSSIPVVEGPERIVENNGKLYVAHKGGYNHGNTVSVINSSNNTVESTISVGDVPGSLEISNGFLYVLCEGKPSWTGSETIGKLQKINLSNLAQITTLDYTLGNHPQNLDIDGGNIYYSNSNSVYKFSESNFTLPTSALFNTTAQNVSGFYGFAVKGGKIFVADANDYSSAGEIFIFSENGSVLNTRTVGVSPNGFYFN
jgi:YVTN family beta-propeller protein